MLPSSQEMLSWILTTQLTSIYTGKQSIFRERALWKAILLSLIPISSSGTLLMASGLISTTAAKETKAKLKQADAFRSDQDGRPRDPRPYSDTKTWRKAMGEKLKYKASELRTNLERCLIAPRYSVRFLSQLWSYSVCSTKGSKDCRCLHGRETVLCWTRSCSMFSLYESRCAGSSISQTKAMRQMKFTEKIHHLGWLDPGFFDSPEDVRALEHCIVRYYGCVLPRRPTFHLFLA